MTIDIATAQMLLEALKSTNNPHDVQALHKIVSSDNEGPTEEHAKFFIENKGKQVKIKHTDYVGTLVSLNTATGGFYPGGRYPYYVTIISGGMTSAIGKTFEYTSDCISLV